MVLNYSENPDERILIESAGCGVFLCYAKQRIQYTPNASRSAAIDLSPLQTVPGRWDNDRMAPAELWSSTEHGGESVGNAEGTQTGNSYRSTGTSRQAV